MKEYFTSFFCLISLFGVLGCKSHPKNPGSSEAKRLELIKTHKSQYPSAPAGQAEYVYSDEFISLNQKLTNCIVSQPEYYDFKISYLPKLRVDVHMSGNPSEAIKRCSDNPLLNAIMVRYSYKDLIKTNDEINRYLHDMGIEYRHFIKRPRPEDSLTAVTSVENSVNIVVQDKDKAIIQDYISSFPIGSVTLHSVKVLPPLEVPL